MNKFLKVLLFVLLIPVGLILLFYGGFAAMLILYDQASYYGNEIYAGPVDYDSLIMNAEKAGYTVGGSWARLNETNLIDPGDVEPLEERFKRDYRVHRVEFYYNENNYENSYLEFYKSDGPETVIRLWYPNNPGVSGLPEDSWMLEILGLSLGLNETASRETLDRLKLEWSKLEGPEWEWGVEARTNESVDFPAVYAYLNQSSTDTVVNSGMWNDEEFYKNGEKIGYIAYIVPEATISTSHHLNTYSVDVSSSGFVRADILMHRASAGSKIPEKEYRAVFKEMFENIGLPAEKVDELEFEYSSSVW